MSADNGKIFSIFQGVNLNAEEMETLRRMGVVEITPEQFGQMYGHVSHKSQGMSSEELQRQNFERWDSRSGPAPAGWSPTGRLFDQAAWSDRMMLGLRDEMLQQGWEFGTGAMADCAYLDVTQADYAALEARTMAWAWPERPVWPEKCRWQFYSDECLWAYRKLRPLHNEPEERKPLVPGDWYRAGCVQYEGHPEQLVPVRPAGLSRPYTKFNKRK